MAGTSDEKSSLGPPEPEFEPQTEESTDDSSSSATYDQQAQAEGSSDDSAARFDELHKKLSDQTQRGFAHSSGSSHKQKLDEVRQLVESLHIDADASQAEESDDDSEESKANGSAEGASPE